MTSNGEKAVRHALKTSKNQSQERKSRAQGVKESIADLQSAGRGLIPRESTNIRNVAPDTQSQQRNLGKSFRGQPVKPRQETDHSPADALSQQIDTKHINSVDTLRGSDAHEETQKIIEQVFKEVKDFHNKEVGSLRAFCPRCIKEAIEKALEIQRFALEQDLNKVYNTAYELGQKEAKEKFEQVGCGKEVTKDFYCNGLILCEGCLNIRRTREKTISEIFNLADTIEWKTYLLCDCGDYNEGCLSCMQKDIKEKIKNLK